jgi:hypothetical protein
MAFRAKWIPVRVKKTRQRKDVNAKTWSIFAIQRNAKMIWRRGKRFACRKRDNAEHSREHEKPGPAPGFFFAARLFRGAKAVSLDIESSWPGLSRPSCLDGHHAIPYRDARHKAGHDD